MKIQKSFWVILVYWLGISSRSEHVQIVLFSRRKVAWKTLCSTKEAKKSSVDNANGSLAIVLNSFIVGNTFFELKISSKVVKTTTFDFIVNSFLYFCRRNNNLIRYIEFLQRILQNHNWQCLKTLLSVSIYCKVLRQHRYHNLAWSCDRKNLKSDGLEIRFLLVRVRNKYEVCDCSKRLQIIFF